MTKIIKIKKPSVLRDDLTGCKFGSWVVLRYSHSLVYTEKTNNEGRHPSVLFWLCRCEGCGKTKAVRSQLLEAGKSTQCIDCRRAEAEEMIGRRFGWWTVLRFSHYVSYAIKTGKRAGKIVKMRYWLCRCRGCKRKIAVYGVSLRNGKSKKCADCAAYRPAS